MFLISCFGFRISYIRASYARQGVRRLIANVVGRGFVLDSDSGDKGIDDVNGYRWAEWARSPEACDDQQELDFHGLEKLTLQHVVIDGDLCSLPNRDGGIESQEGHRLKTLIQCGLRRSQRNPDC